MKECTACDITPAAQPEPFYERQHVVDVKASDAEKLRRAWKKNKGKQPCEHLTLVLERTTRGYLTGKHVCTTCGKQIPMSYKRGQ